MAGIAPSTSTSTMAGIAATTTAAGLAGTVVGADAATAHAATSGYAEASAPTVGHPLVQVRPRHASLLARFPTAMAWAPAFGIGTAIAAALYLRDGSGLGLLAMAVPTLIFPPPTHDTGAPQKEGVPASGLPPPLPEFDPNGPSTAATQDTPPGGGAVVKKAGVFHDDSSTRQVTEDALAAAAAVDRPKPTATHDGQTKPVAQIAAAAVAAEAVEQEGAVLTPRGQMGISGTDHAAFTLDVTRDARNARTGKEGPQQPSAPALTPMPTLLLKDGNGVVTFGTVQLGDGPHLLASVETTKTSGTYRFYVRGSTDSDAERHFDTDGITLNDPSVQPFHAWVDIDLRQRRITVSPKNGQTFAPQSAGETPSLLRNEVQRVVTMGYARSVRLQFGNSFVDVQIPPPAPKTVTADFKGRAEAALERASSLLALAITPRFEVTSDAFTIHIKSGENRSLTLQMPPTIDPATAIDLMAAVLSRTNFLPTVAGHSTPLHLHITWSEPAQFLARLDDRHLDPLPHHLANVGGLLETGPNNLVRIELPSRFVLSDRLDETGGTIFRSRIALASDVLSRVTLEVRQLTVALDYAWAALGRDNSLIIPSRQP